MVDILVSRPGFRDLQVRYVDMADATFAEKIVAVNPDGSNIGGGGGPVDVSDRAARLLGIVYGSGGQLQQNANLNLKTELYVGAAAIDPRSIRTLSAAAFDSVQAVGSAGAILAQRAGTNELETEVQRWLGSVAPTVGSKISANSIPVVIASDQGAVSADVSDRAARLLGVVATVTSLTQMNGVAIQMGFGVRTAGTQRVTIATDDVVPVTGTFWQATQPVSIAAAVDVSDRAARLLGRVYGSQGQQITQTATNFNLQSEIAVGGALIDPRSIRALTASDVVSAQVTSLIPGSGATNLGKAEDAAHTSGDIGVLSLYVRNDALVDLTNADLDYGTPTVDVKGRAMVREQAVLIATTISGANAAVTLTIAAAGAGLFHYITSVEIINVNPTAAAIAGSAVTLGYTSTNIPGAPAWTAGNALAAGAEKVVERIVYPSGGIKTTTANTATTIVAPAIGLGCVCRILVTYFVAP